MAEISVIMPTYNRAYLLENAISSIVSQTYEHWELIIVDDGSTDNTKEVIKKYSHDKRILFIQKENTGGAHSRNVGVHHAKGKYITFLDSDDEAYPDWLEMLIQHLKSNDNDIVCCGQDYYSNDKFASERLPASMGTIYGNTVGRFLAGSFALKKEVYCKIEGLDESLLAGHWTDFTLRLSQTDFFKNITCIDKSLVKVNVHNGYKIRSNSKAVLQGTKSLVRKHYSLLKQDKIIIRNYLKVIVYQSYKSRAVLDLLLYFPQYSYFALLCKYRVL